MTNTKEAIKIIFQEAWREANTTNYNQQEIEATAVAKLSDLILLERIALLAKIANTEGWEESAWVYCTEPEIGLSPNEFEAIRHKYPNLNNLPEPDEDKALKSKSNGGDDENS